MYEMANVGAHAGSVETRRIWAAHPVQLPRIRAQTQSWLAPLGLDQDLEQDLVLAVNEAASNAIEHAYTDGRPTDLVQVSFWTGPHHLYLEVADHGRWRQPDPDPDHRGHGIPIMRRIVGSVSIHTDPDGTRVRMCHPLV